MPREKQLRVILLTSSYPRHATDSASVFLRYLAQHLNQRGIAVHVLAPADQSAGMTTEDGINVSRFRYFPRPWQKLAYGSGIPSNLRHRPRLWLQVPFFALAMTWALFRSLRNTPRPQLIHAHWVIPQGLIAVLTGLLLRVPVVISLHGADAFALNRGPLSPLKRFCLRHCAAWTANTRATAQAIALGHVLPSPRIIPMGVDTDCFGSGVRSRLRTGLGSNEMIMLYVGRLVEKKGVGDLIQAFARLAGDLREKTHLWIVGHGELENSLETMSRELGVGDRIKFWGEIPNDQLPDYYAAADLFVGPSVEATSGDTEGQGVVFIEAFAAGLCVIATTVGGIPEVVDHGRTGILVPPKNPNELAGAIQQLLSDSVLRQRLARNAQDEAREHYAWPRIADEFVTLYSDIATKREVG